MKNEQIKELNESQLERVLELLESCNNYHAFIFEGSVIKGDRATVVKRYVLENSSKKFRIWLIDKGYVINA